MKKKFVTLLLIILLVSCTPKPDSETVIDANLIYTEVAETILARLSQTVIIPESATLTLTSVPTDTATITSTATLLPTITPTDVWTYNPPGKVEVQILLYNHISDDQEDNPYYQWESNVDIPSDTFRQQMALLKETDYTTIPMSLLVLALTEGADLPSRPIAITFDANTQGIYRKAFPIMQEFGFVGTIFIVANHLDGDGTLTTPEVKEMIAAGWEAGSKGLNGIDLIDNYEKLSEEISRSRLVLEEKLATSVVIFSYPFGRMDGGIATRVANWGYQAAVGLFKSYEHTLSTRYYLARYEILNGWTIEEFSSILQWKPNQIPVSQPGAEPVLTISTETAVP
ncbi:MAG: polysaccharide deacetylase family protein [Anaerolineaceae bacterium]|nr:polysaccharide deacetylase family protein [Anaerolineaceae bacterium]